MLLKVTVKQVRRTYLCEDLGEEFPGEPPASLIVKDEEGNITSEPKRIVRTFFQLEPVKPEGAESVAGVLQMVVTGEVARLDEGITFDLDLNGIL
jgi:hypothetical protein